MYHLYRFFIVMYLMFVLFVVQVVKECAATEIRVVTIDFDSWFKEPVKDAVLAWVS